VPRTLEFYFDFISPYGYLGSLGIMEIAARHDVEVDWCPTLLGVSVMGVMGLPPLAETPLKGPYMANDFPRCFRLLGVPLKIGGDGSMPPLPAGRAFSWIKAQDPAAAIRFGQRIYRGRWSEGIDMANPNNLAAAAEAEGFDGGQLIAALDDPEVKRLHRASVDGAIERGVFGVPTFSIDGELFWGHDRLPHVERWLESGGW
jgi:2-hydroxychromene-2-carboxylate isomerase